MVKDKKKRSAPGRHEFDLGEQMNPSDDTLSMMSEKRKRSRGSKRSGGAGGEDPGETQDLDFEQAMGQKILKEAKLQRLELEREAEESAGVSRKGSSSYTV